MRGPLPALVFSLALLLALPANAVTVKWEGPLSDSEQRVVQTYLESIPGVLAARVAVEDVRRDGTPLIAAECRLAVPASGPELSSVYSILFLDLRESRVVPLARTGQMSPAPILDAYTNRVGPPLAVRPVPASPEERAAFDAGPLGRVSADLEKLGFENRADLSISTGASSEYVRLLLRRASGDLAVMGWDGRAGQAVQIISDLSDATQILTRSPARQDFLETSAFREEASLPGTPVADLLKLHSERVNAYIAESRSVERRPIAPGEAMSAGAGKGAGVEKRPISPMGLAERWMREYQQEIGFQIAMGLLQKDRASPTGTRWTRALALRAIWASAVPVNLGAAGGTPAPPAPLAPAPASPSFAEQPPVPSGPPVAPPAPPTATAPPAPPVSLAAAAVAPTLVVIEPSVDASRGVANRAARLGPGPSAGDASGATSLAPGLRRARLLARSLSTPAALPWAPADDPESTIASLVALGSLGTEALLNKLATGDDDARASAARTLADPRFRDDRIAPALARAKLAESEREAEAGPTRAGVWVRYALCKTRVEPEANTVALIGLVKGEPAPIPVEVRAQAALALGELVERRALKPLLDEVRSPSSVIRKEAAIALGRMRAREATAALVPLVTSANPTARADGAFRDEVLVALGASGGEGAAEVLWAELEKTLDATTSSPTARTIPVIRGLSRLPGTAKEVAARYGRWRLATDPTRLAIELGEALGIDGLREWPPEALEEMARDGSPEALEVLCRQSSRAVPIFDAWMKEGSPAQARQAARIAARCGLAAPLGRGASLDAPRNLVPLLVAYKAGDKPSGARLAGALPAASVPLAPIRGWREEFASEIFDADPSVVASLILPISRNQSIGSLASFLTALDGPLDEERIAILRMGLPGGGTTTPDSEDLTIACTLAGKDGDRRATGFVLKAVGDPSPSPALAEVMRGCASSALLPVFLRRPGLFRDEIARGVRIGDAGPLRFAYERAGDASTRLFLAGALGRIGDASGANDVLKALGAESNASALREAFEAAAEIAAPPGAAGGGEAAALLVAVERAIARPNVMGDRSLKGIAEESARRIRLVGATDYEPALTRELQDPCWERAEWAARKLAWAGGRQDLDELKTLARTNGSNRLGEAAREAIRAIQAR